MQSLKDKLYNYEVNPPPENWQIISKMLGEENKQSPLRKANDKIYYFSVAAAVTVFIFSLIFWLKNSNSKPHTLASAKSINDTNFNKGDNTSNDKITIPLKGSDENSDKEDAINNRTNINETAFNSYSKKYITIAGPQGQPVKISSKAATLIVSADHQSPPKAVWSDKVNKWKTIMKTNTLTPTTANFLDIVELTHALKINTP